jgi:hypothetical protein
MTWFEVMGIVSTSVLFLPIITIFALRLAWYKSFPALLFYYAMVASQNFLSLAFIHVNKDFVRDYGVISNFLDAPLMLTFLTYFSKTASFRKKMKLVIPIFVLFELIVIAAKSFNIYSAMIIILPPGLLLVFYFSCVFFIHQAKITIMHQKAVGKACIVASLLFAYGGYSFIYVVFYLLKTPYKADTFLIYYLVSIVSSLLLTTGIIFERKRVSQLAELQTARKELKVVYGRPDTGTAAPKKQPLWKNSF